MKLPKLSFQKNQNLKHLYAMRLFRELVNKLVMFFLPIYFFNLHLPFWDQINWALDQRGQNVLTALQIGIFNIAILHLLSRLVAFVSAIWVAQQTIKLGTKHAFIMGHILYALFVAFLFLSQSNPYWIFLAVMIDGLQINHFWNSYHYSLSRNSNHHKMGSNLGIINFLLNLVTMISPALGGLVIAVLGYGNLFLMGLLLIGVGLIFTILLDNVKVRDKISWEEFASWMSEPGFRRLGLTFAGRYFNDGMLNLWPLYIFILLGTSAKVGLLYSFSLLMAMGISYFVGAIIDKRQSRKPFMMSASILSFFWIIRSFVVGFWSIVVVNTLDRVASSFHWLFFDRVWMVRGKGREGLSYFTYRQMISSVAAIVFWSLVFFLFYFFGNAWTSLFVTAAVGVLLTLLVKEHQGPKF
jgi:MFS-type transporter involved in bile tolerance (Atg22 family)